LAKFIRDSGDETAREEGREIMKWGIIALFVVSSLWGVVAFIRNDLGIPELNSLPNQRP
jgi:hypothetical protein